MHFNRLNGRLNIAPDWTAWHREGLCEIGEGDGHLVAVPFALKPAIARGLFARLGHVHDDRSIAVLDGVIGVMVIKDRRGRPQQRQQDSVIGNGAGST